MPTSVPIPRIWVAASSALLSFLPPPPDFLVASCVYCVI